ncbi:diguanylate cyclase regulator RdcB family protein [Paenibacillus cymbidii]|uniref:diguanylate cyclase regulator RdcB family protein n=1 Tax=Paenibacillus cymbidii TaxID=1639034 RepID=UPI00108036D5|nr:diguanylate cyclase regulator RdcB family protein [Paenibacillus cymbidii]
MKEAAESAVAESIIEDNEICDLLRDIPVLQDKMIIDLVNGLEVAREHIGVRNQRNHSITSRAWDALTGRAARRQQHIDQNIAEGLRTTAMWLENLQVGQIQTDRALTYVSNKLLETRNGVQKLVYKHLELKATLELLDERLLMYQQRTNALQDEVRSIGLRLSAKNHMDKEFDKWEAGGYKKFAPLTQMMLVLEALNWGSFGKYDKENPEFREQVYDKCCIVLANREGINDRHLPTAEWLTPVAKEKDVHKKMFAFFFDTELAPMQNVVSRIMQQDMRNCDLEELIKTTLLEKSKVIPLIYSSKRLSERLLTESRTRLELEGQYAEGF